MSSAVATEQPAATTSKDAFGVEIREGSTIVYAVRKASDTFIKKLFVTAVTPRSVKGYDPVDVRRRAKTLTNLSTTAVLSQPSA